MSKEFIIDEEVVNKVMENYSNFGKKKMIIKEEMFSNYDYINWLNEFSLKNKSFTNEQIFDECDLINVNKLSLFYEVIADYAFNQGIVAKGDEWSSFYSIVYNGCYFEIGTIYGQGSCFFCSNVPFNDKYRYIDFNEIYIMFRMNVLGNKLCKLYKNGYSFNAVLNEFDKSVKILRKAK